MIKPNSKREREAEAKRWHKATALADLDLASARFYSASPDTLADHREDLIKWYFRYLGPPMTKQEREAD
jgi:hypothetical protein